jgi:hypothetical protein
MTNQNLKSKCCNAEAISTHGNDFGTKDDIHTWWNECTKCKQPCDLNIDKNDFFYDENQLYFCTEKDCIMRPEMGGDHYHGRDWNEKTKMFYDNLKNPENSQEKVKKKVQLNEKGQCPFCLKIGVGTPMELERKMNILPS